jgi:carbonic anhydrase
VLTTTFPVSVGCRQHLAARHIEHHLTLVSRSTACAEPDPPHADFPNGWGGFSDILHVDFKIPSEHTVWGKRYDAEMQIYALHPGRKRMPVIVSLIDATKNGYNYYFEEALKHFEYQYKVDKSLCEAKKKGQRQLHNALDFNVNSTVDYVSWGNYSTEFESPGNGAHADEMERELQQQQSQGIWDPNHEMLVPSIHFWRYDGSLTEPPCGEWVSWFISDTPMKISKEQLERMKQVLFTHVDKDCEETSVHWEQSVARPIQATGKRPVWKCTSANFGPDQPLQ